MSGYLEFTYTGNKSVDLLLDVISKAGDYYHDTERWSDIQEELGGESYLDVIDKTSLYVAQEIAASIQEARLEGARLALEAAFKIAVKERESDFPDIRNVRDSIRFLKPEDIVGGVE